VTRAAVSALVGEEVVEAAPVRQGTWTRPNVWRVVGASGRQFAVKEAHHRAPQTRGGKTATQTEWAVLSLLAEIGCAAPHPVAHDEHEGLLATAWIGGETLDDMCQTRPAAVLPHVPAAIAGLAAIERAFAAHIADVEPFAFQQDYDAYLGDDFALHLADAQTGYRTLRDRGGPTRALADDERRAWAAVARVIYDATPTMGTLDYNARNVLFAGPAPVFVDFSTVGWDWPERRVAQYFVSLGANRPNGNFVQAVGAEALRAARDCLFFDPIALEAHLFVFLCVAAGRLARGGTSDRPGATMEEQQGWANRRARFDRLLGLLAGGAVADFDPTALLRGRVRQAAHE
jgi:hypothetical protein